MPNDAAWRAEARVFAAYLGSSPVPTEVVERYGLALADWRAAPVGFDSWLRRIAAAHPLATALADAYARFIRPYGDLRRRLTLMLALLETHGTTHELYDRARRSNKVLAWLSLALGATAWAIRTLVAFVLIAPLHALARIIAPAREVPR